MRELAWEQSPRFVALYVLHKINEEIGSFPWEWNREEFTALTNDFKTTRNDKVYSNPIVLDRVKQHLALTQRKLDVERMTLLQHQNCFNSQRLRCECIALVMKLLQSLIQPLEQEIERAESNEIPFLNVNPRQRTRKRCLVEEQGDSPQQ